MNVSTASNTITLSWDNLFSNATRTLAISRSLLAIIFSQPPLYVNFIRAAMEKHPFNVTEMGNNDSYDPVVLQTLLSKASLTHVGFKNTRAFMFKQGMGVLLDNTQLEPTRACQVTAGEEGCA